MRYPYHIWPSALSEEVIDNIVTHAETVHAQKAQLFSSADSLSSQRSSQVRWLTASWISDLILPYAKQANESFKIDFENDIEIQFTDYLASEQGHYDWHHDVNWHSQSDRDRKLSVTIQLSDGDSYEGGDFEFEEIITNTNFRAKGSILIFPSYLRHRVTTVTKGRRHSLVAWYSGPNWQ